MNYKYILYAIAMFTAGQLLGWFQFNGPILWTWAKQYRYLILLLGYPVSWFFMQATSAAVDGFGGEFWPSRFLSFVVGILIFTVCTYIFKSEPITTKTAICLLLAFSIVFIQLFWK
jgi:hypothetical protein